MATVHKGTVHSVSVTGAPGESDSAQVVFDLNIDGVLMALVVDDSAPQVFAGFVSVLTTAFAFKLPVSVSWVDNPGNTPKANFIQLGS